MNEPRRKNPVFGIGVFIVVVVLFVIGTVLFNATREKREYDDEARQAQTGGASASAVASQPASAAQ